MSVVSVVVDDFILRGVDVEDGGNDTQGLVDNDGEGVGDEQRLVGTVGIQKGGSVGIAPRNRQPEATVQLLFTQNALSPANLKVKQRVDSPRKINHAQHGCSNKRPIYMKII